MGVSPKPKPKPKPAPTPDGKAQTCSRFVPVASASLGLKPCVAPTLTSSTPTSTPTPTPKHHLQRVEAARDALHLGDIELELGPQRNLPPAAVVARLVRVGVGVRPTAAVACLEGGKALPWVVARQIVTGGRG